MTKILENILEQHADIERIHVKQSLVNGFLFEVEFFKVTEEQKTRDVACRSFSKRERHYLSFSVAHVKDCTKPLISLHHGVLYALRNNHPIIYGVGFLGAVGNQSEN